MPISPQCFKGVSLVFQILSLSHFTLLTLSDEWKKLMWLTKSLKWQNDFVDDKSLSTIWAASMFITWNQICKEINKLNKITTKKTTFYEGQNPRNKY